MFCLNSCNTRTLCGVAILVVYKHMYDEATFRRFRGLVSLFILLAHYDYKGFSCELYIMKYDFLIFKSFYVTHEQYLKITEN